MTFIAMMSLAYGTFVGAALASFACVLSERVPRGEPFASGHSRCVCGRNLRVWENVPVLGWVMSWGRARCCGARIPARYVLAEAFGALFGAVSAVTGAHAAAAGVAWFWIVLAGVGAVGTLVWLVAALTWQHPTAPGTASSSA